MPTQTIIELEPYHPNISEIESKIPIELIRYTHKNKCQLME